MSTAQFRAFKLQQLRASHADDAATKPAWKALQIRDAATADIDARRTELEQTGRFTPHGIYEELKPLREKHAQALRDELTALQSSAEKLLTTSNTEITLPADHQRILNYWTSLPPGERQSALVKAMSGRDADLAATLAHKSNERYVGLTDRSLQVLRSRFANADASEANVPRFAAHQIANEILTESLANLEQ